MYFSLNNFGHSVAVTGFRLGQSILWSNKLVLATRQVSVDRLLTFVYIFLTSYFLGKFFLPRYDLNFGRASARRFGVVFESLQIGISSYETFSFDFFIYFDFLNFLFSKFFRFYKFRMRRFAGKFWDDRLLFSVGISPDKFGSFFFFGAQDLFRQSIGRRSLKARFHNDFFWKDNFLIQDSFDEGSVSKFVGCSRLLVLRSILTFSREFKFSFGTAFKPLFRYSFIEDALVRVDYIMYFSLLVRDFKTIISRYLERHLIGFLEKHFKTIRVNLHSSNSFFYPHSYLQFIILKLRRWYKVAEVFSLLRQYASNRLLVRGLFVEAKGRLTKRQRASVYRFRLGSTPFSTRSEPLFFFQQVYPFKYGSGSVKICVFLHFYR
jgi:hypothetical protein